MIHVQYAPSVKMSTSTKVGLLTEGDTVKFKCKAYANPPPLEYSWYIDSQRVNGFESDLFMISNISKAYNDAIVKCEVKNDIGKSEETETIHVKCK